MSNCSDNTIDKIPAGAFPRLSAPNLESSTDWRLRFFDSGGQTSHNPFNEMFAGFGQELVRDIVRNFGDEISAEAEDTRKKSNGGCNAAGDLCEAHDKAGLQIAFGRNESEASAGGLAASRWVTHPLQTRNVDVFERFGLEMEGQPNPDVPERVREGMLKEYGMQRQGLQNVPDALYRDCSMRLKEYIPYVKSLKDRHWVNDPARVNDLFAWESAAEAACADRNARLCEVRTKLTPEGLSFSEFLKEKPVIYAKAEKNALRKLKFDEGDLSSAEKISVSQRIIESSAKTNAAVDGIVHAVHGEGRALGAVRAIGKAATVAAVASDTISLAGAAKRSCDSGDWKPLAREGSRVAGGWTGAALASGGAGAVAGSVLPGLGTIGGFAVGAVAGATGYWLGSHASTAVFDKVTE